MSASSRKPDSGPATPAESTTIFRESISRHDLGMEVAHLEVLREMGEDWALGARTPAEIWLDRYPQLAAEPETAVQIIYEEVCLREEQGEQVDAAEVYRRFPQWTEALRLLFDCHQLIEGDRRPPVFPEEGERLGELQLLRKLGRGAAGRVYLATQPSLSDRPLVVKLTARSGDEHLSLARLQHTHIAPLYLVQDFPSQNLRAMCMPYLGGLSWASVLATLNRQDAKGRSGRRIVEILDTAGRNAPVTPNRSGPALGFLSRATYVQAVCWIGACLADALQYAHQRGLVHLDIKPSNVLLADDGQPMLLDFHLALEIATARGPSIDRFGGTRGYMSPEQEQAAAELRSGSKVSVTFDGRSDVYSLGVLLYESFAGQLPAADEARSRHELRSLAPEVGRGLEDVIHKCLARAPAERYGDAGQLATDLRRHLADLPLQGVPNRSFRERWQKWRRRRPHAFAIVAAISAAFVAIAALGLVFHRDRMQQARTALAQSRQDLESGDHDAAITQLQRGSDAIALLPGEYDLKQALANELSSAKKARLAGALHQLVEQLRFLDSFESVPAAKLQQLNGACAKLWNAREKLADRDVARLLPAREEEVRTDLLDLAALWAQLTLRLATTDQSPAARDKAAQVVAEAESLLGKSPVLELTRREIQSNRGEASAPVDTRGVLEPKTAREHYLVGRYLFRLGEFEAAQQEFQQAIDAEPNAFWPNFYQTLCDYRLEDFEGAWNVAGVCVALAPKSPECFFNRALCQQALGRSEQALDDFSRALALDPTLAVASLRRGTLASELGRYPQALKDFHDALDHGAEPAVAHYQAALAHLGQRNLAAARESLRQALNADEDYAPALALKARLGSGS